VHDLIHKEGQVDSDIPTPPGKIGGTGKSPKEEIPDDKALQIINVDIMG
jgi:hypothetical protein